VPSILLVAGIQVLSGVLALCYRGEGPHGAYSKLQEGAGPPHMTPPAAEAGAGAWQQGGQNAAAGQQGQRHKQQRHKGLAQVCPPEQELELLRGSYGDSMYSS
jgi:hypothetical protein